MPSTRLAASRQTAKASGSRSSSVSTAGDPLAEFGGLAAQRVVGQRRQRRFERIDLLDGLAVPLQQPLVAAAEDLGEKPWIIKTPRTGRSHGQPK
jgi:hypothetical protein